MDYIIHWFHRSKNLVAAAVVVKEVELRHLVYMAGVGSKGRCWFKGLALLPSLPDCSSYSSHRSLVLRIRDTCLVLRLPFQPSSFSITDVINLQLPPPPPLKLCKASVAASIKAPINLRIGPSSSASIPGSRHDFNFSFRFDFINLSTLNLSFLLESGIKLLISTCK
ncbi:hypothetical protein L2E82_31766 [Cichorium intybus]|uniref:Uncharacterized protein n=1 Tax=Cichorium intybus TaxID=13427 RepID=A0ACB9BFP4_CICIN|nr:hypothetical protein L2E82_31766 [Cichorium intybus]